MKKLKVCAAILGLTGLAYATAAAAADDAMVTKAPPVAAASAPAACANVPDFFLSSCILSWYGITVYGTVDFGVGYESHGVPFNGQFPTGVEYLLQKNSNRSLWLASPNGLSQSAIGIKGNEQFAPGWSFVFDLEAGFDPYSLQLANGPSSIYQNAGVPLASQNTNADSSRAGQFYNALGYVGVSSATYGTLTFFRQNSLTLDGVLAYDPMGGSYAFSPIGWQGTTCGVGDTEDCRISTAVKYRVSVGNFRAGALAQVGGYQQNNGSNGEYEFQLGGDIPNLGTGLLSMDAIYSNVRDAVNISVSTTAPYPMAATISNDQSVMALAKYKIGQWQLYTGYEWIQYAPPSDPQTVFTDISGTCVGVTCGNNTTISNTAYSASAGFSDRNFQVFWTGVKYSATDKVDVVGAYYHYSQGSYYGTVAGGAAPCSTSAHAQCAGTFDAVSAVVDWRFAAKFDTYIGFMFSQVNGGLSNGYLARNNFAPTAGLRFRF